MCAIGGAHNVTLIIKASSIFSPSSKPSSTQKPNTISLGKNWTEYHGSRNWKGLLDPLDDTLRSELLRYGKFVQATYDSFDFDLTSESYATSRFHKNNILPLSGNPNTGYNVTRNLHASSGIQLPNWAETTGVVPSWFSNNTSWIGYVAVCQDENEIARLGRRDVVIAFRGTATCLEWLENLRATLTHVSGNVNANIKPKVSDDNNNNNGVMVERGFWSLYSSAGSSYRSLQEQIRDEIGRLLQTYGGGKTPLSVTITGHSLGAALAVLAAYDVKVTFNSHCPHLTVISYGGPRVGNARFRRQVEELGIKVLRIVNTRDIVTKLPGFLVEGGGSNSPCWISKAGLAYSDVGQELRVSCSSGNMAACHDLSVYLQLVKQLKASCPFTGGRSGHKERKGFRWPSLFLPTTTN